MKSFLLQDCASCQRPSLLSVTTTRPWKARDLQRQPAPEIWGRSRHIGHICLVYLSGSFLHFCNNFMMAPAPNFSACKEDLATCRLFSHCCWQNLAGQARRTWAACAFMREYWWWWLWLLWRAGKLLSRKVRSCLPSAKLTLRGGLLATWPEPTL